MEKFISYEKLSKKEKRKIDQAKRQTWGELNPVTRKPENSKAYNRKKSQDWKRELPPKSCDFCFISFRLIVHCFHKTIRHIGIYRYKSMLISYLSSMSI